MENISFTQGNSEDLTAQVIFYLIISDLLKDEDDDEAASSGDMTLAQLIEFFKNKGKIELSLKMIKKLLLQFNSDINLLSGIKLKDKYDMLAEIKNLINKYSKNIKGINFARDFNNDLINTVLKNNRINKVMSTNINSGDGDIKGAKTVLASLMIAGTALINKAKAAYKIVANKFNKVSEGHSKTTIASGKAKGTLSREQLAEMSASQLFKSGKDLNTNIAKGIAGELDNTLFTNARPQQREMDILATARARALDRNAEPVYVNAPQQGVGQQTQQRQYDINNNNRERDNTFGSRVGGRTAEYVAGKLIHGAEKVVNTITNNMSGYVQQQERATRVDALLADLRDDGIVNGSKIWRDGKIYDTATGLEANKMGQIIGNDSGRGGRENWKDKINVSDIELDSIIQKGFGNNNDKSVGSNKNQDAINYEYNKKKQAKDFLMAHGRISKNNGISGRSDFF